MNFIIKNWVRYCTKEIFKTLKIVLIGFCIIISIIVVKYKPVYAVSLSNETIGLVLDKEKLDKKIDNYINEKSGNIAFRVANVFPQYSLKLVDRNTLTNEKEVLEIAKSEIITTYETYAITVDGEQKAEVISEDEAIKIVQEIKDDLSEDVEINIGVIALYTNTINVNSEEEAKETLNIVKAEKIAQYEEKKKEIEKLEELKKLQNNKEEAYKKATTVLEQVASVQTVKNMQLNIPVQGTITSRFGSRSSIRSSAHTGLDIATSRGTAINPISEGIIVYTGYKGSYGNLVIIDHNNGVQSYYAHCNRILANIGDEVDTNTIIAEVGTTGNSTGPHLHLEIRVNGEPVNPQQFLYN